MKVLINSPTVVPLKPDAKYQGIERLALEYAVVLTALGHEVTIIAAEGSSIPPNIKFWPMPLGAAQAEQVAYPSYKDKLSQFDVIHDFSHFHAPAMADPTLPTLNVFWHDPYLAKYPEPKVNIIALSEYGARNFEAIYGQKARYQETIEVDPTRYAFSDQRNGRFLTVGKMSPEKGNLDAMRIARKLGVGLDVVGGVMPGDPRDYDELVRHLCYGDIVYWGNASDDDKIKLMQTCRALIYYIGQVEIHSHKAVEAMMTGCPVITFDVAAMDEVVGKHYAVVKTEAEFISAMRNVSKEDCWPAHVYAKERWDRLKVVSEYVTLYKQVAGGLRW